MNHTRSVIFSSHKVIVLIGICFFALLSLVSLMGEYVMTSALASSVVVEVRVSANNDDAEESDTGEISRSSTDLELVETNGYAQKVGIRFTNVELPPQATITAAYIQFQAEEKDDTATFLTIAGEASDHAPIFMRDAYNISHRLKTEATAIWNPPAWDAVGEAGPAQQTPDLSAIIQEIVNRPGWVYGNALALIITGHGIRAAESFDGSPEAAPLLHIEYSGGIFPTATPTSTPLPPGPNYRFAVIGDFGNDSSNERRVADLVNSWQPDFVITLGDNNYPDGATSTIDDNIGQYYSHYIGNYQGEYGSGSPINRFWPSLGNHDWHSISCNDTQCNGPYFDYFTLPGNERYYDVDFGLVHLFTVDSDSSEPDGNDIGDPQSRWLQNKLVASTACFNVVYFHHAPYSSGEHGSYSDMQWPFGEWGADVVMTGHDHDYERLDIDGVPYFVNGIGGQANDPFPKLDELPPEAASIMRYNEDAGAMLVTVTEVGMSLQLYNTDNLLIDTYNISKNCTANQIGTPTPATGLESDSDDSLDDQTSPSTPLSPDAHYRFAVIGDYGDNSARSEQVSHLVGGWQPDFVITLGDNNYPSGEADTIDENIGQYYSQFIGNYQGKYGGGSLTNRFWPSLGNHDWLALNCENAECHGPYFDYFTLPGNERFYDVDYGLVHLFAVDGDFSEPDSNRREGSQAAWLQTTLMTSTACFKIVYFHNSPYSSGHHGSQLYMQWPFADWGADIVLSGHDHDYERLEVAGLPYIVNGLGGGSITSFDNIDNLSPEATSLVRYNQDGGAMLVDVTVNKMLLQFYNTEEMLIDEYTINKSCSIAPTITPTPISISLPAENATPSDIHTSTPTAVPAFTHAATNTATVAATITVTAIASSPQVNDSTGLSLWLLSIPIILLAGWFILQFVRHKVS